MHDARDIALAMTVLATLSVLADPVRAQAPDGSELYRARCAACHGADAAAFADGALVELGGRVVSVRSGREILAISDRHGALSATEATAVSDFLKGLTARPRP